MTMQFQGGAVVEGLASSSIGLGAHAEGFKSTAGGSYSHAEGGGSVASGNYAHAEGSSTSALSNVSHAEGGGTTAGGVYTHAEGQATTASANSAHAEGYSTTASGPYSHAGGLHGVADAMGMFARGAPGWNSNSATRSQTGIYTMTALTTTSGAAVTMTADGSGFSPTNPGANVVVVPIRSVYAFTYMISGRRNGATGYSQAFYGYGAVVNDAGSPIIMGTPGAFAWNGGTACGTLSIVVSSGFIAFNITPAVTASIGWTGTVYTNELTMTS